MPSPAPRSRPPNTNGLDADHRFPGLGQQLGWSLAWEYTTVLAESQRGDSSYHIAPITRDDAEWLAASLAIRYWTSEAAHLPWVKHAYRSRHSQNPVKDTDQTQPPAGPGSPVALHRSLATSDEFDSPHPGDRRPRPICSSAPLPELLNLSDGGYLSLSVPHNGAHNDGQMTI